MLEPEEIERLRRSAAMAPLAAAQVEQPLAELATASARVRHLEDGLRALLGE